MKKQNDNLASPAGWRLGLMIPGSREGVSENASVAAWLIRLRWVALVAQIAAGLFGFRYIFLEPLLIYPFFGTVCFIGLYNFFTTAALKANPTPSDKSLFFQVGVDTAVLSFLLALSGGTRNPFVALLFIHATLGALLLRGRYRAWFVVLLLACLVGVFGARNWQVLSSDIYVWEFTPLLALLLSLLVSWGLVLSLSDTLFITRKNLSEARSREDKINHLLALGALTAEFAHQFATPLNTLRLRIARLNRNVSPVNAADLKAISDTLDQSEQVLKEMTTAPLDSSMLLFEEVDLAHYVANAIQQWETVNPRFDIKLNNSLGGTVRCRIPTKVFVKSLFNLFDNAAFSSEESITLELGEDTTRVFVSVMDRGPGWPSELMKNGIRPHFTTRPGGTGLGLFNCQCLCEVIGGSLELLDRKGGGAIVKLALPKTA